MSINVGRRGEEIAAEFLKKKGYKIVETNWRPHGKWGRGRNLEIDIVAKKGRDVVFVEVKALSADQAFSPEDHFTRAKQNRIRTAARIWCVEQKYEGGWQIDLAAIEFGEESKLNIRYYDRVC